MSNGTILGRIRWGTSDDDYEALVTQPDLFPTAKVVASMASRSSAPTVDLDGLVRMMVDSDVDLARREVEGL